MHRVAESNHIMPSLVLSVVAVLCHFGREVTPLGGLLLSVQSKLAGLEDPKSIEWKHSCAGIVLSVQSALTCASCLVYPDDRLGLQIVSSDDLRLYGGNKCPDQAEADPNGQVVYVRAVQVHPEYFFNEVDQTPNEYNFAILDTKKPFSTGDSLRVLPLYSADVDEVRNALAASGTKCFTMTWYFYVDGNPVNENPERGEIPVTVDKIEACGNLSNSIVRYASAEHGSYSCAKGLDRLPVCRVDTGSPVVCEGKLLAIIINDRLNCDTDEEHVVMSGINNALPFLTNPDLYRMADTQPTQEIHTTVVEIGGRSSQGLVLPQVAAVIPAINIMICSIKGFSAAL